MLTQRKQVDLYRQFVQGTSVSDLSRIYKIAPWQVDAIVGEFKAEEQSRKAKKDYIKTHKKHMKRIV